VGVDGGWGGWGPSDPVFRPPSPSHPAGAGAPLAPRRQGGRGCAAAHTGYADVRSAGAGYARHACSPPIHVTHGRREHPSPPRWGGGGEGGGPPIIAGGSGVRPLTRLARESPSPPAGVAFLSGVSRNEKSSVESIWAKYLRFD
jgi:hypothetical protein